MTKKLLAFLLVVVLIFTQFIMLNVVSAQTEAAGIDSLPAYPEYASVEIYKDGWKNSWGTNYDWAGSRFKCALASPVDLSGVSQFEFDIYIEDNEAFQAAAEAGGLVFVVGSGDNEYKQRSGYSFAEQVTQNGWNHIVIDKNSAVKGEKDTDFTSVNRVVFTFWAGGNKANPIAETETRIVNICGTIPEIERVPTYPEYASVEIWKDGLKRDWGTNYDWASARFYKDLTASPVDLSGVSQFEFDIYIEDKEAFQSAATAGGLVFVVGSGSTKYLNRSTYSFADQVTKNGWNHIVINKENKVKDESTDFSSVKWVLLTFWDGGTNANPIATAITRIANICGTNPEIERVPTYPEYASVEIWKDGLKRDWGTNYDWASARFYKDLTASPVDLSGVSQFEFDIYIEDKEAFQSAATAGGLVFVVGSGSTKYLNRSTYSFADQVTKNGWNHIVINKENKVKDESTDFSSVKWVLLTFWAGGTNANPIATTVTRIANICGTYEGGNIIPTDTMTDKIDFVGAIFKSFKLDGDNAYTITLDSAKDVTAAKMIELDVFVTTDTLKNITVGLKDTEAHYAEYTFQDLVKGWNHLAVRISDLAPTGEIDYTNITYLTFKGVAGTQVTVSNFYAANYVNGDANRDGLCDIRDLVRTWEYITTKGTAGNAVAMDTAKNDYTVNAEDLSALRVVLLG